MNKKILYILPVLLISFFISTTGSYILFSIFKNQKIMWDVSLFSNTAFWGTIVLATIALMSCFIYMILKSKFFSSGKLISTNDRTESNLYDNQDFMSEKELQSTYGNYDFKNLSNISNVNGYVLSSKIDNKSLKVSLISRQHAILVGTNGTGKSLYVAGLTIQSNAVSKDKPTMIINDESGELYRDHSQQLIDNGYNVELVNLRSPRETLSRYNPCSYIWDLYEEFNQTNNAEVLDRVSVNINELALILCSDSKGSNDKNWSQGARGIIIGCLWGMLEDSLVPEFKFTKDMFTITQISNIVNRQKEYLLNFLFERNKNSKVFDFAGLLKDNAADKTVDGYISHLQSAITLFLESGMQFVTSATDFDIKTIVDKPTAIFIIVPAELPSRAVIGAVIYAQLFNFLVYKASTNESHKLSRIVYFILDEFGNLPKIQPFPSWISTCRKMDIFFFLMVQALEQLDDVYDKEKSQIILNNCHCQMYLGSSNEKTVEYFQKKFGTYTALNRNRNLDTANLDTTEFKGSTSLVKKSLVTQSDLQQIVPGNMFAFILRKKPLHTTLVPIFDNVVQKTIKIAKQEEIFRSFSFENIIYDLELRTAIYLTPSTTKEPSPINDNQNNIDFPEFMNSDSNDAEKPVAKSNLDFLKR